MGTGEPGEGDRLVAELDAAFADLRASYAGLEEAARTTVVRGRWTLTDLLAHIAGWHWEMVPALERLARGEKPVPEGTDYTDFDAWNARFVAARRGMTPAQVEADLEASFAAFRRALLALPEPRRRPGRTAARLAREAGTDHYRHHAAQVRAWRQRAVVE